MSVDFWIDQGRQLILACLALTAALLVADWWINGIRGDEEDRDE